MKFQVTTSFNNITVLAASFTVSKKKLTVTFMNETFTKLNTTRFLKRFYKAAPIAAMGCDYTFTLNGTTYVVRLVK